MTAKEKKRERQRKWYWSHREQEKKRQREWHKAHYIPHPRKKRVLTDAEIADRKARRYMRNQTDARREYSRNYYRNHRQYFAAKKREYYQKFRLLMARSPELYAMKREADRMKHRRIRDKFRKRQYKACVSRRIPDFCVFCASALYRRSVFLRENLDADAVRSCDNYAMMLASERRERRFA